MYIVNGSGQEVAAYSYDPYGNVITATGTLAEVNPLRYRGYYYDSESGLYYLQSRYYDPEIGRFINADGLVSTGQGILGNNMFAYCGNCPTMYTDPSGNAYKDPRREAQYTCIDEGCGSTGGGTGATGLGLIALGAAGFSLITGAVIATYDVVTTYVSTHINTKVLSLSIGKTKEEKQYQYWEAYRIKNHVYIGNGLTFSEASIRVASGFDIMCANESAARWLLVINGYWNHVGPEIHGDEGYYWHFHPNRNSHIHIWYY